jgi:hypothetical protein
MSRFRTTPDRARAMPSLFRFLAFVGIVAGAIYAGMLALVQFYDPPQREITVSIPPDRFSKQK